MISRFKFLGVATVALFAMSAMVGAVADAAQFTANSYPTTVTATSGLGNAEIQTEAGSVECKEHFEGTLSEASETLELTPSFSSCRAFGFLSATVSTNKCVIKVHANGEADLECPSGVVLAITSGSCEFDVFTQTGLKWITLTNNGSDVDIKLNLSNLTYQVTKDGFLCPFSGTGHKTGIWWIYSQPVTTNPVAGGNHFTVG